MSLFLCGLDFCLQYILMHVNFFLPFLHTLFQLIFPIFQRVYSINFEIEFILNFTDFKLHAVDSHQLLFFLSDDPLQILILVIVFQCQFVDQPLVFHFRFFFLY